MRKNVAGQKICCQMVSASDGSAFTGSVTVYVTGDAGPQAVGSVGSGAATHEGNGLYSYTPSQAETNYDHIAFTFVGTGAVPATVQVYTRHDANVTQIGGDSQSATDLKDFADAGYDPSTNKVQGVVLVDTATTVTNRVTANADQVDGSAPAAASLKNMALVLATGAVVDDASNTATTFKTDLTETADDYYGDADGGNVLAFVSGTTNATQTRRITAYNGTTKFVTVESAFDAEPAADDAFILLGRIEN